MAEKTAWHDAYPTPRNQSPDVVKREELLARFHSGQRVGSDFLLVDLRRQDHNGGTIRGSINLPAQTLYSSLPTLMNLCEAAKIETVIWYCGSSRGRGSRAAGWFEDMIADSGNNTIRSMILLDGIAGWVSGGPQYVELMDEYDATAWAPKEIAS